MQHEYNTLPVAFQCWTYWKCTAMQTQRFQWRHGWPCSFTSVVCHDKAFFMVLHLYLTCSFLRRRQGESTSVFRRAAGTIRWRKEPNKSNSFNRIKTVARWRKVCNDDWHKTNSWIGNRLGCDQQNYKFRRNRTYLSKRKCWDFEPNQCHGVSIAALGSRHFEKTFPETLLPI